MRNLEQRANESQSEDDEIVCFISIVCISMDSGAINIGLITQEFWSFDLLIHHSISTENTRDCD